MSKNGDIEVEVGVDKKIEEKIRLATAGMPRECYKRLLQFEIGNVIIADYLIAYKRESDVKDVTRATACRNLLRFAEKVNKPFVEMTREDVFSYLDGFKKPDSVDPLHKWKGMYTLFSTIITRFFKWFYHPDINPSQRPEPTVVANIPKMKRKEKNYRPSDMWTLEESEIFFKYCPTDLHKIRCYHAIAVSTGARPHEILKLKIEDIIWPPNGEFPSFVVNGKTGTRSLTVYFFHKYVQEWIEQHPFRAVRSSILVYSEKTRGILHERSLAKTYRELKSYFTKLLEKPIGQDDRNQIQQLLSKPWNPYVLRHTTATKFLGEGLLNRTLANQWFGWSQKGNTASVYENFYGNEAGKRLVEAFGLAEKQQPKLPKLVQCPNVGCRELNNPDAPFCTKCRVPLTPAGFMEKESKIELLERQMEEMLGQAQLKDKEFRDLTQLVERIHKASIFIKAKDLPEWGAKAVSYDKFKEELSGLDEREKAMTEEFSKRAKILDERHKLVTEQYLEREQALAALENQHKRYMLESEKRMKEQAVTTSH
ncbi:MAG: tyrosine-type recombinase/integrase [Candidatus Nitrosopolaris sp.]|jgi:integrase